MAGYPAAVLTAGQRPVAIHTPIFGAPLTVPLIIGVIHKFFIVNKADSAMKKPHCVFIIGEIFSCFGTANLQHPVASLNQHNAISFHNYFIHNSSFSGGSARQQFLSIVSISYTDYSVKTFFDCLDFLFPSKSFCRVK